MAKGKAIALGSLTTVALVLICIGVVYWQNNTSGDFVTRVQQTGGEIVNQIKSFTNALNEVSGWLKQAVELVRGFFTGIAQGVGNAWSAFTNWWNSLWGH